MSNEQDGISGTGVACGDLLGGLLWGMTVAYFSSFIGTILSFDLSSNLFATLLFFTTPVCGFLAFFIWFLTLFASEKPKFFPFATIANVVVTILFIALWCFLKSSLAT
ncbi:MAG: hypothetical protein IJY80_05380 [Opitutales bacterium]|nr:hypothetical protein [Opitutales bacterium]MBQ9758567.1 hypothetical protein [Opitutales bacterium]